MASEPPSQPPAPVWTTELEPTPPPRPPPPPNWYMQQNPPHYSEATRDGPPMYEESWPSGSRANTEPPLSGSRAISKSSPHGSRVMPVSSASGSRDLLEFSPSGARVRPESAPPRSRIEFMSEEGSRSRRRPESAQGYRFADRPIPQNGYQFPRSRSEDVRDSIPGRTGRELRSHSGSRASSTTSQSGSQSYYSTCSRRSSGSAAREESRNSPESRATINSDRSGSGDGRFSRFSLEVLSPKHSKVSPHYPGPSIDSTRNSEFGSSTQSTNSARQRSGEGCSSHTSSRSKDVIELRRLEPSNLLGYLDGDPVPRTKRPGDSSYEDFVDCELKTRTPVNRTAATIHPTSPPWMRRRTDVGEPIQMTGRTRPARRIREVKCCGKVFQCPDLDRLSTRQRKCCRWRLTPRAKRIIAYTIPICLLVILFFALMPVSFVYIEHYQMALQRQKSTGIVDKSTTIYPGCYVEGPDAELLVFKMSAHVVKKERLAVFSSSRMEIWISLKLIYFIRPEELGQLYAKFGTGYEDIIDLVLTAMIKNRASLFTLEEVRLQRPFVEQQLHEAVRDELNEFHVDVPNLWLGKVDIPPNISQNLLRSVILQVSAETEHFVQDAAVVKKETEKLTEEIRNTELEVKNLGDSGASLINSRGQAKATHITESSTISGWDLMCDLLGITDEEQKLSVLFITSLSKMDNLYFAPSEAGQNYTYSYFPGYQAAEAMFG